MFEFSCPILFEHIGKSRILKIFYKNFLLNTFRLLTSLKLEAKFQIQS